MHCHVWAVAQHGTQRCEHEKAVVIVKLQASSLVPGHVAWTEVNTQARCHVGEQHTISGARAGTLFLSATAAFITISRYPCAARHRSYHYHVTSQVPFI